MTSPIMCWSWQVGTMVSVLLKKKERYRGWHLGASRRKHRPGSGPGGRRVGDSRGARSRRGTPSALDMLSDLKPPFPHLPSGNALPKGIMRPPGGGWETHTHACYCGHWEGRASHMAPPLPTLAGLGWGLGVSGAPLPHPLASPIPLGRAPDADISQGVSCCRQARIPGIWDVA